MGKGRLNPLNDYLFGKYMGEPGDEEQLIAFLNAVLKKTKRDNIVSVTILENKSMITEVIGNKSSVFDIRAETNDGSKVNIEVQLRNVSNMDRRSLFYWSLEYSKSIKSGKDYTILPNVISINILGTEFLSSKDFHTNFHTSFHIREDTKTDYILTDALEMHFIDMVKFRRVKDKDIVNNILHRWLTFFDKKASDETVKKIIEMDTAIKKAHEKITYVAQDNNMLHTYQMYELAIYDYNSSMNAAKQETKALVAINMKRNGFSIEEIAICAMLSKEEVVKILEKEGLI
jgi:predicted transposase/invertase (TIGR01784 family)